ncbi:MAG: NAD(P)H-binding protein [Chitinophaga sp.]|uniref:NAD(P)H-binding protein n=1 Tax=Chitinophaga sp. TaxID=1869181 RepID=UPI001B221FCB|nr:NAD(P)H-binding protein [Chitinophaga sp.]MBO9732773.1 NAD(P)H-binding protein [Chitinophaga sp.]
MKTKKNIPSNVLVLGGTGKTGSRVAAKLKAAGWPVRIGSRSGSPAFDWEDATTWGPALAGMDAVYLSYQPDLAVPGALKTVQAFTKVAVEKGIRHIVLLSGRGEKEAQAAEDVVMNAGIDWTILRAAWFSQNFSEGYLLDPILAGHVALPAGNVVEPFVDADDIADVAVAAFTEEGHAGQLYELTGPRLMTFAEAVADVARATGKPLIYQQLTMEEYKGMMLEYQVPEDMIWLISYLFTEVLDGRNTYLADGVQRALGRAPKDFSTYAETAAGAGVWNA